MDENPYRAPREKPIDSGSEVWKWRAIDWTASAAFILIWLASIGMGLYDRYRSAVVAVLIVVGAIGFYAYGMVRRAKRRLRAREQ
jgi:hypothetical protein